MKKNLTLILCLLAGFSILVSGCKKGDDDPALSLRSRKARVTGKWRLREGNATLGITDIPNAQRYNEAYLFDGSGFNVTYTGENVTPMTAHGTFLLNIEFTKDGNFKLAETFSGKRLTTSGSWDFNSGVGSEKKKEILIFSILDASAGKTGGGYWLFNQNAINFKYKIKALRNKEMVITTQGSVYIDATGTKQSFDAEFTLVQ